MKDFLRSFELVIIIVKGKIQFKINNLHKNQYQALNTGFRLVATKIVRNVLEFSTIFYFFFTISYLSSFLLLVSIRERSNLAKSYQHVMRIRLRKC